MNKTLKLPAFWWLELDGFKLDIDSIPQNDLVRILKIAQEDNKEMTQEEIIQQIKSMANYWSIY